MRLVYLLMVISLLWGGSVFAQDLFLVNKGAIKFNSKTARELIHASSDDLKGYFDIEKKVFAFKIDMISFAGFNSPLQREHFNESYMETSLFPQATFSGKVIENVDLRFDGEYNVRAKGKLVIHGIERERIINSKIKVDGDNIYITSVFTVTLADHDIKIHRVVYEKLAPEISVEVTAALIPKPR